MTKKLWSFGRKTGRSDDRACCSRCHEEGSCEKMWCNGCSCSSKKFWRR